MQKLAHQFWDLDVYQATFSFQQAIFKLSADWPKPELYALTDQVRRSSRSIGANLAEAWAKRRYPAHFLSKLTDCDGELQETRHWLMTAEACAYLDTDTAAELCARQEQLGRMLGAIMRNHTRFTLG